MPRLSRWLIRAALAYLLVGSWIGALMLAGKGWAPWARFLGLLPVHEEVMLIGWMVQLVVGVAVWILPRLPGRARETDDVTIAWVLVLLNAGVVVSAAGAMSAGSWLGPFGRVLELAAVLLFLRVAWPRVRRYGLTAAAEPLSGRAARSG